MKDVLQECKTVALKRRKANSRLENLGIPEEELLRQQQELFAKVRIKSHNLVNQTDRYKSVLRIKTDNLFDSDYFLPHLCTFIDHLHQEWITAVHKRIFLQCDKGSNNVYLFW